MGTCCSSCVFKSGKAKLNKHEVLFVRSPPAQPVPNHPISSLRFQWSIACSTCSHDILLPMGYGGKNNIMLPEHTHTMYINLRDSWKYACSMCGIGRILCSQCYSCVRLTSAAAPWRLHVNMPCRYELRKTKKPKFTPRSLRCVHEASVIITTSKDDARQNEWMHLDVASSHVLLLSTQVQPSADHSYCL